MPVVCLFVATNAATDNETALTPAPTPAPTPAVPFIFALPFPLLFPESPDFDRFDDDDDGSTESFALPEPRGGMAGIGGPRGGFSRRAERHFVRYARMSVVLHSSLNSHRIPTSPSSPSSPSAMPSYPSSYPSPLKATVHRIPGPLVTALSTVPTHHPLGQCSPGSSQGPKSRAKACPIRTGLAPVLAMLLRRGT